MKQVTLEMPLVSACSVSECGYNVDEQCRARAITVGDGIHPGCDTYFQGSKHAKAIGRVAGVGACKVTGCKHNDDYECMIDSIQVGMNNGAVDCLTYQQR